MNRAKHIGGTAAELLSLFLAYDYGKSNGRQEVKTEELLRSCVNTRYVEIEELKAQVKDYLVDISQARQVNPLDLSKKEDFDRYKKTARKMGSELIHLREHCQQLVRSGVTDFAYSDTALKPEMKKVLEERYRKLLRDEAGKPPVTGQVNGKGNG